MWFVPDGITQLAERTIFACPIPSALVGRPLEPAKPSSAQDDARWTPSPAFTEQRVPAHRQECTAFARKGGQLPNRSPSPSQRR